MLKIVWITASRFSTEKIKGTGSWQISLANELVKSGNVVLTHFALIPVDRIIEENILGMKQYVIPNQTETSDVLPDTGKYVQDALDSIKPDVIHIWGTESNIASLYKNGYLNYPTFVDIQGFMPSIPDKLTKGLTIRELLNMHIGKRELLHPRISLLYTIRTYKKKAEYTIDLLSKFKVVSVQSSWVEAQINAYLPNIKTVRTDIILRDEFYSANKWEYHDGQPTIFTCASSTMIPYKGLYTLLKGLKIIKQKHQNIKLRIAGTPIGRNHLCGFERLIYNFIHVNQLEDNIEFVGLLDADGLINELQKCNVCVVPSYVETYCLALAEAQMIGTPCVVSYAGAMPEIAEPNRDALFYEPLDIQMLAYQVNSLLSDKELCNKLSHNAIAHREYANSKNRIVEKQIENYHIIKDFFKEK